MPAMSAHASPVMMLPADCGTYIVQAVRQLSTIVSTSRHAILFSFLFLLFLQFLHFTSVLIHFLTISRVCSPHTASMSAPG